MTSKRRKLIQNLKLIPNYIFLIISSFLSIFPFLWMIIGATNKAVDITQGKLTPGTEFVNNFINLNKTINLLRVFFNTSKVAILGTVLTLLICSLAGYGYEIFKNKFREKIYNLILLIMMVPFAALMIPLFRMFAIAGQIDTHIAVILPFIPWIFILFYFRQSTKTFERELISAARIDGLNEFQIFFFIYFPTMKSSFAAAAIITFMFHWNNFLWPLIILQSNEQKTMTLAISSLGSAYFPDFGIIMMAVILATLPIILVFFLLQKQFVEGMLGSVK